MLRSILIAFQGLLFLGTLFVISIYRTALIASIRGKLALLIITLLIINLMGAAALIISARRERGRMAALLKGLPLGATFSLLLLFGALEFTYRYSESGVESASEEELSALGQHFIVGFRDYTELRELVKKGAIGGVYFTKRNFRGRTPQFVAQEIELLQGIRRERGELPLIICADQEGGIVSHLSPPLKRRPSMAEIVRLKGQESSQVMNELYRYGLEQGRELGELGFNLNFSPVVDLKTAPIRNDRYSQIYYRALSADPSFVATGGLAYCRGLAKSGVGSTLKHFPGLGRAREDSHFFAPRIKASREELAGTDWLPFQLIGRHRELPLAIMVGHSIVEAVDAERPASLSTEVVKGLLREDWGYEGLIVTDDFSMFPISLSRDGLGSATRDALNNGVDYILLSYDHELYYYAMKKLIGSYRRGKLDSEQLSRSKERMGRFFANPMLGGAR